MYKHLHIKARQVTIQFGQGKLNFVTSNTYSILRQGNISYFFGPTKIFYHFKIRKSYYVPDKKDLFISTYHIPYADSVDILKYVLLKL